MNASRATRQVTGNQLPFRLSGALIALLGFLSSAGCIAATADETEAALEEIDAAEAEEPLGASAKVLASANDPSDIAADASDVFWTDEASGKILRVGKGGGATTLLHGGECNPSGIALDSNYVYWTTACSSATNYVKRIKKTGGAVTTIAQVSSGNLSDVVVNATYAYFADRDGGRILKAAKGGGGAVYTFVASQSHPSKLAIDGSYLYWTNWGPYGETAKTGTVRRAPLAGGTVKTYASSQYHPYAIEVDGTYVYWVNYGGPLGAGGSVRRISKGAAAGTSSKALDSSPCHPLGLAIDASYVYWTEGCATPDLGKVAKSGSSLSKRSYDNVSGPWSLAVDDTSVYFGGYNDDDIFKTAK